MASKKQVGSLAYPELEFWAGAWQLLFWGQELEQAACSDDRYKYLDRKRLKLRSTITLGTKTGKQQSVPAEIIDDEYRIIYRNMKNLIPKIKQCCDIDDALSIFEAAQCFYSLEENHEKSKYWRPFIPFIRQSDSRDFCVQVMGKKLGLTEGSYWLVGQLFGISNVAVKERVLEIRRRRNNRKWVKTSENQRFLIAILTIGMRTRQPVNEIVGILEKLKASVTFPPEMGPELMRV